MNIFVSQSLSAKLWIQGQTISQNCASINQSTVKLPITNAPVYIQTGCLLLTLFLNTSHWQTLAPYGLHGKKY